MLGTLSATLVLAVPAWLAGVLTPELRLLTILLGGMVAVVTLLLAVLSYVGRRRWERMTPEEREDETAARLDRLQAMVDLAELRQARHPRRR